MRKLCFLLILCFLLTSCASYKNDIPVQLIAATLREKIEGNENLAEASADYIKYCMDSDLSLFSEYIILYPFAGTKYNEIGVFKAKDGEDLSKAIAEVEKYISFKKSNWDTRYKNNEFIKIENAKPIVCGNYILYTILSNEEAKVVSNKFKSILKK